ncbi:hypothetical protein [Streptomyces sp. NPDC005283]
MGGVARDDARAAAPLPAPPAKLRGFRSAASDGSDISAASGSWGLSRE